MKFTVHIMPCRIMRAVKSPPWLTPGFFVCCWSYESPRNASSLANTSKCSHLQIFPLRSRKRLINQYMKAFKLLCTVGTLCFVYHTQKCRGSFCLSNGCHQQSSVKKSLACFLRPCAEQANGHLVVHLSTLAICCSWYKVSKT